MEWLREWLQQLVGLLVVAAFFDLLVAHHAMHKYVKLVISLCILMTLLQPVARVVQTDFDQWLKDGVDWSASATSASASSGPGANQSRVNGVVTASQNMQQTQIRTVLEERMATELSLHLQQTHRQINQCTLELIFAGEAGAETIDRIEWIQCMQMSERRANAREFSQPEENRIYSPVRPVVMDPIEIAQRSQTPENREPDPTPERIAAEEDIRTFVRSQWSLEVNRVEFQQLPQGEGDGNTRLNVMK